MARCAQKTNQNKTIIEMSMIKRTSTISFRIDSEYDKLLRNEAEQHVHPYHLRWCSFVLGAIGSELDIHTLIIC